MTHPGRLAVAALLAAASVAHGDEAAAGGKADAERRANELFGRHDRNGDGTLRGAEVPAEWADRFDRDGDDEIARSEFLEVSSRPEKFRRLHFMRDPRARALGTLRGFDKNGNGTVQREEYPGRADVFRGADRNRDDALDRKELLAMATEELEDVRRRMRSPGRTEFLTLFDLDRDDRVASDEYDGPAPAFRKFDTDGDGVVTYAELYPERMRDAREAAPASERLTALQALDKDGDGRVARSEFAGAAAAWRRLDTNGDGWITAADAR